MGGQFIYISTQATTWKVDMTWAVRRGGKWVLFKEEGFFLYRTWKETFWKAQRDVKRYVTVSFAKKVNFSRRRSWFGPTVKTYGDKTGGGLTSNISVILGQRMSRTSHGGIPFFDSRFLCPQSEDALFRHLAGRAWLTSTSAGKRGGTFLSTGNGIE